MLEKCLLWIYVWVRWASLYMLVCPWSIRPPFLYTKDHIRVVCQCFKWKDTEWYTRESNVIIKGVCVTSSFSLMPSMLLENHYKRNCWTLKGYIPKFAPATVSYRPLSDASAACWGYQGAESHACALLWKRWTEDNHLLFIDDFISKLWPKDILLFLSWYMDIFSVNLCFISPSLVNNKILFKKITKQIYGQSFDIKMFWYSWFSPREVLNTQLKHSLFWASVMLRSLQQSG